MSISSFKTVTMSLDLLQKINSCKGNNGELDLSSCKIDTVPLESIKRYYGQPTSLILSYNMITSVSHKFVLYMMNLTKLDLSRNFIKKLSEEFGCMTQLEYLNLNENRLETLPVSMSKMDRLVYLNISNNPLRPPLSTFLEQEIANQRSTYGVDNVNVAGPIVEILMEIAQLTAKAPKVQDNVYRMYTDENNNLLGSGTSSPKGSDSCLSPRASSIRFVKKSITSLYSSLARIKHKLYSDPRVLKKWLLCIFLQICMFVFIAAMMADPIYFENFGDGHPYLGACGSFFQPLYSLASTLAGVIKPPLIIRGVPFEPVPIIIAKGFSRYISQMFRYNVDHFTTPNER